MKTTQQTLEVLAAILALSARRKDHLADDGKESPWERLGYFQDWPKVKKAWDGIKEVPAEIADMASDEVPEIARAVSLILNEWGVNHRSQDITAEVIRGIVDAIPVFKEAIRRWEIIASMPPVAIPA